MKHNTLRTAASLTACLLSAVIVICGCQKDKLDPAKVASTAVTEGDFELTVAVSYGPSTNTKTTITQSSTILPVKWKTGDKLYVVGATDGYLGSLTQTGDLSGDPVGRTAYFKGNVKGWSEAQVLHIYYLGDAPTIDTDNNTFSFDISSQEGTLAWIASKGQIAHGATASAVEPGTHTIAIPTSPLTMYNLNAVILYDLSAWTSGVEISGTYNSAVLNLKTGTFDTKTAGDIALAADKCTASTYVTFIPDNKALTFKKEMASTPTKANNVEAGKFYSKAGEAIMIPFVGNFSIGPDKFADFAPGNLQYQASTNTWRFAEHQWDYVGDNSHGNVYEGDVKCDNEKISDSYTGWIDSFGWGTSGIDDYTPRASSYKPWSTSKNNSNYYAYGNNSKNLYDDCGKADWGYNTIVNGGNKVNSGWRTLTADEWEYLVKTRKVTVNGVQKSSYGHATVNDVNGLIILPDSWNGSVCTGFTYGNSSWSNKFSESTTPKWSDMENAGVLFLPAAGYRYNFGDGVLNVMYACNGDGDYWSSSISDNSNAYDLYFENNGITAKNSNDRCRGRSVRLAKVTEKFSSTTE